MYLYLTGGRVNRVSSQAKKSAADFRIYSREKSWSKKLQKVSSEFQGPSSEDEVHRSDIESVRVFEISGNAIPGKCCACSRTARRSDPRE